MDLGLCGTDRLEKPEYLEKACKKWWKGGRSEMVA